MDFFRKLIAKINANVILRNVLLAVCGVIVFVFFISILLNIFTRHNQNEVVPDLSGLTTNQAKSASRKASLRIEINDSLYVPSLAGGVILDQLPKPGAMVKSGRRVFVTVNSYSQKMVEIPYVTGYSLRQAKNNLEVAGLEIEKLIFKSDIASNYVLEEQFKGRIITRESKLETEQGSGITLIVGMSGSEPPPQVPKLIGFPLNEAKSRIWEAGLNVGRINYDDDITLITRNDAKVYVQSPGHGARANAGSEVTITLTLDTEKIDKSSSASDRAAKSAITIRDRAEEAAKQEAKENE